MSRKHAKRSAHAHLRKQRRKVARIHREHGRKLGYLGAVTGLTINGKLMMGVGALFLVDRGVAA